MLYHVDLSEDSWSLLTFGQMVSWPGMSWYLDLIFDS